MYNICIRLPFPSAFKSVDCEENGILCSHLQNIISTLTGISDFSLHCNGKKVLNEQHVLPDSTVHVSFSLPGGKGGFGSMLRAIGAQIEKTTNREACRDLSGRRLRDINEEQRLKNWIAKKSEREADKMRRRKERIERLKSRPKHNFVDFEYEKEISELPERIDDALSAGMEKAKKRPPELNEPSCSNKKKKLWLGEEESSDSDSDPSHSNEESHGSHDSSHSNEESHGSQDSSHSNEESHDSQIKKDDLLSSLNDESNPNECRSESSNHDPNEMESQLFHQERNPLNDNTCLQKETVDSSEDKGEDIDLNEFQNAKELEAVGLDRLKKALMLRGLKCGGNLVDRAARLWAVRGLNLDQYPKNLLAKHIK